MSKYRTLFAFQSWSAHDFSDICYSKHPQMAAEKILLGKLVDALGMMLCRNKHNSTAIICCAFVSLKSTYMYVVPFPMEPLILVRRNKGRTPTPRSHPSAPSFDFQKQAFSGLLETTPSKHDKAKKKVHMYAPLILSRISSLPEQALFRDGYRCILSGKLDFTSVNANLVVPKPGEKETTTEASHIFDRSTNEDLDDAKRVLISSLHLILLTLLRL